MTVVDRVRPAKSTIWGWSPIALVCELMTTITGWRTAAAVGLPLARRHLAP